jgi:NADPH oxidase
MYRFLQARSVQLRALNNLRYSVWISRGSAIPLSYLPCLLLLTMSRWTMTKLYEIFVISILDEITRVHQHAAYLFAIWSIVHTLGHYVKWITHVCVLSSATDCVF